MTNEMLLKNFVRELFVISAVKPENKNMDGSPNWNYIEADIYMGLEDLGINPLKYRDLIDVEFDKCADVLEEGFPC